MKKDRSHTISGKAAGIAVMAVLAVALITLSGPVYKKIAGRGRPVSDTPLYHAGIYTGSARGYGGPVEVTVRVSEYAIEDVSIKAADETPEIGQAAAVKIGKEMWLANSHSVDSVSGATMTSNAVKKALAQCFREAAREDTELYRIISAELSEENSQAALPEVEELLPKIGDGTYTYRDGKPDGDGNYNEVMATVKDHRLTGLLWDVVNEAGVGKRELSANGQYVMTENGPLWYEQADALATYVVEHQSAKGLMSEGGTSDAVASVSIHIGGFVDTLKKCLLTATGDVSGVTVESLLKAKGDGTYTYTAAQPDDKGFRDQIELTVKDHKITALTWDAVGEDGVGKRKLSANGTYVMTEDGPLWYEQADALAAYLAEHQSEDGLLDESGYATDAVASVSIYAGGFVDAVKKCLMGE